MMLERARLQSAEQSSGRKACRVGKGEGFADLEWAMMREVGMVDNSTAVCTTVHDLQLAVPEWEEPLDELQWRAWMIAGFAF